MVKLRKRTTAAALAVAVCVSGLGSGTSSSALSALAKKVTLNQSKATLYLGAGKKKSTVKLKAKIKPAVAARAQVMWSSSSKKVASVSQKGMVKAKKPGKTTITARVGIRKAVCRVTVKKAIKVKTIRVSQKEISIRRGESAVIMTDVLPVNAMNKDVTFKSANKKIATVFKSGGTASVKGISAGITRVTVSAKDGSNVKAVVMVKVTSGSGTQPSAKPDVSSSPEPEASPSAVPETSPSASASPTATPWTPPNQQVIYVYPASPTATPAPTATPDPVATMVPVEPDEDGGYLLSENEDFVITDGESSISVDGEMIAQCNDILGKLDSGINLVDRWEEYEELLKPGDKPLSATVNGCKVVLSNVDGVLEAEVTMEDGNDLSGGSYKIRRADNGIFQIAGGDGMITSAEAVVARGKYILSGIVWSDDAPSVLKLIGSTAVVDVPNRIISSGDGKKSVDFSSGEPRIIGLPEDVKVYKKVYKKVDKK